MVDIPDAMMLDIMDRVVNGQTYTEAGAPHGKSKNAISGMMFRVARDLAASEYAPFQAGGVAAVKPENQDGGMPARWWEAGLRKRLPGRLAPSNRRAR